MRGFVLLARVSTSLAVRRRRAVRACAPTAEGRPLRRQHGRTRGWRRQVALGPRPAGSRAASAPRSQSDSCAPLSRGEASSRCRGGLRNVIGGGAGRQPGRTVIVGAHYDTKDFPASSVPNDGASGVAVVLELARIVRAHPVRPTILFVLFDGEESPSRRADEDDFYARGLRGSKVAPSAFKAESMILLDLVGRQSGCGSRASENSNRRALGEAARGAKRVGVGRRSRPGSVSPIGDDHMPFASKGVPRDRRRSTSTSRAGIEAATSSRRSRPASLDAVGEANASSSCVRSERGSSSRPSCLRTPQEPRAAR